MEELRREREGLKTEEKAAAAAATGMVTVTVIYYLTRHGQLQHPHFLQLPLSSSTGLFLRDVIRRLDVLRGEGLSRLYSWSSKRQYKNGYVWQDLSDDDLIPPSHGQDYILKGSELELRLLESSSSFRSCETSSETNHSSTDSCSWNSLEDLCRNVAYRAKISAQSGMNAWTQTGERTDGGEGASNSGVRRTESSRSVDCDGSKDLRDRTARKSNRWNPSTVLMQLIKNGSRSSN